MAAIKRATCAQSLPWQKRRPATEIQFDGTEILAKSKACHGGQQEKKIHVRCIAGIRESISTSARRGGNFCLVSKLHKF